MILKRFCVCRCLRYATTGNFPPGSYGGRNFVHDPSMSKLTTVMGHLKMSFIGNDNKRYILSRSVQAKQGPKQISIKTFDSTLSFKGTDGKQVSLSSKCADINAEMIRVMGVTDPILNYVIFCHQEDSNWPLDESSKVKQKFDEIFAAAKYNDCLKHLKSEVRKAQMETLKVNNNDVEHYSDNASVYKRKEKEMRLKKNEETEMEGGIEEIRANLKPLNKEYQKICQNENSYVDVKNSLTKYKTSLDHCSKEINDLRANLNGPDLTDRSEEKINEMKSEIVNEERKFRNEKDRLSLELRKCRKQLESENEKLDKVKEKIAQCSNFRKINEKRKQELQNLLGDIGQELEWDMDQDFSSKKAIEEAAENIEDTKKHFEDEKRDKEDKFSTEIDEKQSLIRSLEIEKAQLEQKIKSTTDLKIQKKKELAMTKRNLSELEGFSSKLAKLKIELQKKDSTIDKMKTEVNTAEMEQEIADKTGSVQQLDRESKNLRQELAALSSQREISSQLTIKQKDLDEKKKHLKRLLNKCEDGLEILFHEEKPDVENLKKEFKDKDESVSRQKTDLEQKVMNAKSDLKEELKNSQQLNSEIKSGEKRIEAFEKDLGSLNAIDTFDNDYEAAKANVVKIRDDLQAREANKHTFKAYIEKMKRSLDGDPSCPTCNRNFKDVSECEEVISFLSDEIERVPQKVKFIEKKLKEAIKRQERMESLYPEKAKCLEIRNELDSKRAKLEESQKSTSKLKSQLKTDEEKLEEIGELIVACSSIREDVLHIDNLNRDFKTIKKAVQDLETKLGPNVNADRTYEQVKNEEDLKTQELDLIRDDLETLRSKKTKHDSDMNKMQSERNSIFNEKLQLEARQQDRANMEEKKQKIEDEIIEDEKAIAETNKSLRPIEEKVQSARKSRDAIIRKKDEEISLLDKKAKRIREYQINFEKTYKDIKDYEVSRNEDKLLKYQDEASEVKEAVETAKENENESNQEIQKIEKLMITRESRKRELDDNLKLKKYLEESDENQKEIDRLKEKLKRWNYEEFEREKDKLARKITSLNKNLNENTGHLQGIKNHIGSLQNELDDDRLKLACQRYREKLVERQCRKTVVRDLDVLYKVLDRSVMDFHKDRMKAINKIIKELWRATYKGNDIDHIEIKTDDDTNVVYGADKRRNYNYRYA